MHKLLKQAFTLIELLVVIAIIGILSGLIIVGMNGMTQKATIAKAQVFSSSLRNSLMLNLISEWKFDGVTLNGNGATPNDVLDTWSGGHNCSITGSILVRTGNNCISGSCLEFNGGYLSCGDIGISNGSPTTIEGWFYTHATAVDRGVWVGYINNLYEHTYGPNRFQFSMDPNPCFYVYSTAKEWKHIVITYSGNASTSFLYVNGQKYPVVMQGVDMAMPALSNFLIGYVTSLSVFDGIIDNVRVYNAILPISQIKEQYYTGLNKLLANRGITSEEYQNRIGELAIR